MLKSLLATLSGESPLQLKWAKAFEEVEWWLDQQTSIFIVARE